MKKDKNATAPWEKTKWYRSESAKSIFSALISIAIGLFVGAVIVIVVGLMSPTISSKDMWDGFKLVLLGVFSTGKTGGNLTFGFNPVNIGNMLFRATPLIMTGLSVAVAFKTGLFNIGAPGQFLMGTMGTLSVGLWLGWAGTPAWLAWLAAFVVGVVLGALWGCIPGAFKAYLNINEVITCIMTNWIAASLVTWWFDSHNEFKNSSEGGKVAYIIPLKNVGVVTPKLGFGALCPGSQANGGFWIAVIIAIGMWVIMSKTTFGYELKACGANKAAAKYAGINGKRNQILSMAIAGALAAAGAALYYLSGNTEFYWSTYMSLPAVGFNGIPVALLASNHPIGVIFAGIFMSMLNIAGLQLKNLTMYNEYISDVIIAVIVYLSAFALFFRQFLGKRGKNDKEMKNANAEAFEEYVTEKKNEAGVSEQKITEGGNE
ncbi:MAG: ABC transporter permease [Clostridiales bacterium]|nr:ABC transporter permease [Candidatus Crickella caballi]